MGSEMCIRDSAFNCGLLAAPASALQRALHGTPAALDAALIVDDAGRSRHYINVAGMLFDAAALMQAMRIQYLRGPLIYLVAVVRTILQNHFPTRITLLVDGEASQHTLLMLTVANGAREGGGFICAPQALPDDGWLAAKCRAALAPRWKFKLYGYAAWSISVGARFFFHWTRDLEGQKPALDKLRRLHRNAARWRWKSQARK